MCGIVGAVAERDVSAILVEGLRRLEYRGYDSAGLVLATAENGLLRYRSVGKVAALVEQLNGSDVRGGCGLAHTRWATHGAPTEHNAHPHLSSDRVAVVHNGIIENHAELRAQHLAEGYEITSDTDTEVVAHEIHRHLVRLGNLREALTAAVARLEGAYALAVIDRDDPTRLLAARRGSPLVVGVGIGEHFVASDVAALLPVTRRFVFLEDGDIAEMTRQRCDVWNLEGEAVERPVRISELSADAVERGDYRHYMLKEIHEQPRAVAETLEERLGDARVLPGIFGPAAADIFAQTRHVHIVACGTSYHAGMVARYWIEALARLPCTVEIASEYRYREPVIPEGTLFVTLSQSGETADTLAALRATRKHDYVGRLAVCNVAESSLVRESELVFMTRAGPEIGVASTKAFTTQLVAMMLLTMALGQGRGLSAEREAQLVADLRALPARLEQTLALNDSVAALAERFADKQHALFLGRGAEYPIALEGALKLKEISYIHAEAYAAGELKHGPLALVDEEMPVVAVAASNELLGKLLSNLQEVRARGGELFVFADSDVNASQTGDGVTTIRLPDGHNALSPVLYTVPLQLLAYHVAVLKGTDVDQPRNLAKSVTVE